MIYKEEKLKSEWSKLSNDLKVIIKVIDYSLAKYDMQVRITCVLRTVEENKELYERLKQPVVPSLHSYFKAIDFTVVDLDGNAVQMTDDLIDEILDLNDKFPYGDGKHKTIIYHKGTGWHFHVQEALG